MKPLHAAVWLLLGIFLSCWLIFVWPTPWQHYQNHDGLNLRVNRFTGATQSLDTDGWHPEGWRTEHYQTAK